MAGFTNFLETSLLNHLFTDPTYTPPATLYVALFTADADGDGTGYTEVTGGAYARVATTAADWSAAVAGAPSTKTNTAVLTFPEATASWGTVTHFGLMDASTTGNQLTSDTLTASVAITTGMTPSFAAGAFIVKLGDPTDTY